MAGSFCGQEQRHHHVVGGTGRRWRRFGAALVAIGGCCVASVGMLAHATLPGPVKECTYAEKSTAAKPCTTDLFMGEHMTYECASGHTSEPTGAQTSGKYCQSPLTDSGSCGTVRTLEAEVGTTSQDNAKVVLRLKEEYDDKFTGKITYMVRCVDGANKMFVKVDLWPFTRPLSTKPKENCANEDDAGTSAAIRCNFFAFKAKAEVDCRETGQTGSFVPGDAYTNSTGKVCTTGFKAKAEPECLADDTWANVAAGAVVSNSNTNQTLEVDSKALTAAKAIVYIGCTRSGGGGGKKMFSKGMLLKDDFVAIDKKYVPMIKHVCTPSNGKAVNQPCEAAVGSDEAVVVVCAKHVTNSKYKLMPADVNKADGQYCTAMPQSFNGDCSGKAKWKETAKAEVMTDATMDFFIVALPSANAGGLKTPVTTYGYCSDETNGVAFKITLGASSQTTTTKKPDDNSAAIPMTYGGAVMGVVTVLSAAMAAFAVL